MIPFVAGVMGAAAPSLEQEEAIVLRTLNDCTPLPKDLQLLVIQYWRPVIRLIAYKTDKFTVTNIPMRDRDDSRDRDRRVKRIEWSCIPYDSRVKLPASLPLRGSSVSIFKFRKGLLIEQLVPRVGGQVGGTHWTLDYYPDIYRIEGSTDRSSCVSIAISSDDYLAVVGKHADILIAFVQEERMLKMYDFDSNVWRDQMVPDSVRNIDPHAQRFIRCPGKILLRNPIASGVSHLYDGVTWTTVRLHGHAHGLEYYDSLFVTDTTICFKAEHQTNHCISWLCFSIATGELIDRTIPSTTSTGERSVASCQDGLLLYRQGDLFMRNCVTSEMNRVATGVEFSGYMRHAALLEVLM